MDPVLGEGTDMVVGSKGVCVLEKAECPAGKQWSSGNLDGVGRRAGEREERKWAVKKEPWAKVRFHQQHHYTSMSEILSKVNQILGPSHSGVGKQ